MPVTEKTLSAVKQYHELGAEIDGINRLVCILREDIKNQTVGGFFFVFVSDDIAPCLGGLLVKSVGPGLIKLLEAERVILLAEQAKLDG